MIDLKNKIILITGASSGIGRAAAVLCDKAGAKTIICGRNKTELLKTKTLLKNKCLIVSGDLSKPKAISSLVSKIGNIDGLAHCAGIVKPIPVKFISTKHIEEIFAINFTSAVLLCCELLKEKKLNAGSSVVFISSVSVDHPYIGGALYSSSKAALEAYSKTFALENASKKIRANVVSPALVRTKIFEQTELASSKEEFKKHEDQYPLGFGEPEDVANAIVFLLSSASKWITGTNIKLDGGLLLNSKK